MSELAVILDTETTGVDPNEDQVIEFARLAVHTSLEVHVGDCQRFKPTVPIKFGAMATHNIHESDLEDQPAFTNWTWNLLGAQYIIGHNVDFDWKFLGKPPVKRICTLAIARWMRPNLDAHTLAAMMYYLKGVAAREPLKEAHGAMADCKFVLELLKEWTDGEEIEWETWEDLWQISEKARLPTIMTFGKHKGCAVSSVPHDYRQWYFRQPDPDPYLLKAWGYSVDTE